MGDRGQIAREVRDPLIPDLQIRIHSYGHRGTLTELLCSLLSRHTVPGSNPASILLVNKH